MSVTISLVSLLHLISTAGMVGVIWIVQLTHYPTFRFIDPARFTQFATFHGRSITYIVLPLMLLEAVSAALLYVSGERSPLFLLSLFVLLLIWTSTFFIQVPLHNRLGIGSDHEAIEKLITSNWLRTVGWSIRVILLIILVGG